MDTVLGCSIRNMSLKKFALVSIGLLIAGAVLFILPWTRDYEKAFFFRSGADFLADFLNTVSSQSLSEGFSPYHYSVTSCVDRNYPPFPYVLCLPFVPMMPKIGMSLDACHASVQAMLVGVLGVGLMVLLFFISLIILCRRFAVPVWVSVLLVFSGQALFCYERGNMILLSLAGIMLFLSYFQDERSGLRFLAAFGLAVAVALKVTPVLFGVLWLGKKDWKWLMLAGGLTLGLSFVPLLFSDHSVGENILKLLANVAERERVYVNFPSLHPSNVVWLFLQKTFGIEAANTLATSLVRVFKWANIALGLLALCLAAFRKMRCWQRLFLLASSQILLLVSSQQYVLLFFVPSLVSLLAERIKEGQLTRIGCFLIEDLFLVVLVVLIILPFPLFVFRDTCINFAVQSFVVMAGTITLVGVNFLPIFRSCLNEHR